MKFCAYTSIPYIQVSFWHLVDVCVSSSDTFIIVRGYCYFSKHENFPIDCFLVKLWFSNFSLYENYLGNKLQSHPSYCVCSSQICGWGLRMNTYSQVILESMLYLIQGHAIRETRSLEENRSFLHSFWSFMLNNLNSKSTCKNQCT